MLQRLAHLEKKTPQDLATKITAVTGAVTGAASGATSGAAATFAAGSFFLAEYDGIRT